MSSDSVQAPSALQGGELPASNAATTFPVTTETVTTHFKLIFISILLLEVALLIAMNGMAIFVHDPSETVKSSISTCSTLATAGFGAICGLIGGKAIS